MIFQAYSAYPFNPTSQLDSPVAKLNQYFSFVSLVSHGFQSLQEVDKGSFKAFFASFKASSFHGLSSVDSRSMPRRFTWLSISSGVGS